LLTLTGNRMFPPAIAQGGAIVAGEREQSTPPACETIRPERHMNI